jgi:hypothetical protein
VVQPKVLVSGLCLLAGGLSGCAPSGHRDLLEWYPVTPRSGAGAKDASLIFNPEGVEFSLFEPLVRDWPVTEMEWTGGEQVYFRETLIDTQQRHFSRFDSPYRRLTVVRTGAAHR